MKSLEDEVDELEKLDQRRVGAAEMRDKGREALRSLQTGWGPSTNSTETALVVKALCDHQKGPPPALVLELESLTVEKILREPVKIPVLRAARSMQALAAAPDSAFSEALLVFYYQIVRETYTADAPDWRIGGARAASGGSASAYVTGECVRALLGFVRTLENTGTFLEEISSLGRRRKELSERAIPASWCGIEIQRLSRSFYTSVIHLLDNISFKIDQPNGAEKLLPLTPDLPRINRFVDLAPERITGAVHRMAETFNTVIGKIKEHRQEEKRQAEEEEEKFLREKGLNGDAEGYCRSAAMRRFERAESGHAIALGALEQGRETTREAVDLLAAGGDAERLLDELATKFRNVAKGVKRLLHPERSFLSTVLDRELAAASSGSRPRWDPAEMAFAAISYGYAAESFEDDRLRRAGICLSEELSERGRFRSGTPFHVDSEGNYLDVLGAEVIRAFSQLLEKVEEIPVDDALVKRMQVFFQDTRRCFREQPDSCGWCPEQSREPSVPVRWVSAVSVLALDRMNRMLDARINTQVFRHFSVKGDKSLKTPPLRDLFYPDYGLRNPASGPKGDSAWDKEESVALALERMRTHILGLSRREKPVPALFSLILYGPPGTGKTTLVEALAKSAGVPLVEVTPSDIVSSGADVVERRARAVFKALSFLTRVVILFDEFDPVLKRRNLDDREPSTVFSFVTPGMLPKLKTLHDEAKRRRVGYVLITNLIGMLDGASVRSGRFDAKLGIYPPDPLSRQGRLLDELLAFQPRDRWPNDLADRVRVIVQKTGGAQMETLVQEGWFRRPEGLKPEDLEKIEGTPFRYAAGGDELATIERPEAEVELKPPSRPATPAESDKAAEREYHQREWLRAWEQQILAAKKDRWQKALTQPPRRIPRRQESFAPSGASLAWDLGSESGEEPAHRRPGPPPVL